MLWSIVNSPKNTRNLSSNYEQHEPIFACISQIYFRSNFRLLSSVGSPARLVSQIESLNLCLSTSIFAKFLFSISFGFYFVWFSFLLFDFSVRSLVFFNFRSFFFSFTLPLSLFNRFNPFYSDLLSFPPYYSVQS